MREGVIAAAVMVAWTLVLVAMCALGAAFGSAA